MEDLHLNKLDIFSDKDTYELFLNIPNKELLEIIKNSKVLVIDEKVLELYKVFLDIDEDKVITITALEDKKRPEEALSICEQLMLKGITREDTVVAIGGGITQDLVTFAVSMLFRGIKWIWIPTTLLAQADSCIGGKSSLNFKSWKNIIGNFYPPSKIYIQANFLKTLSNDDIRSGIGEILKVHLLSGRESAELILRQMSEYKENESVLQEMIFNSLKLKNKILEIDPLDQGLRLKMNYGHSFGHALESATNFEISHGIAVTMGLDMANYISYKIGKLSFKEFELLHVVLYENLQLSDFVDFSFNDFVKSIKKDKKNSSTNYNLIIPISFGEVELTTFVMDDTIEDLCNKYFDKYYIVSK